jgi:hypothetical protein
LDERTWLNHESLAKHPTLLLWFWAVVLGFVALILVIGLLSDDD